MSYVRFSSPVYDDVDPSIKRLSMDDILNLLSEKKSPKDYYTEYSVPTSDAYVYESCYGGFVCHWSAASGRKDFNCTYPHEMAEHLAQAKAEGLCVPQYAIDALYEEAEEHGYNNRS